MSADPTCALHLQLVKHAIRLASESESASKPAAIMLAGRSDKLVPSVDLVSSGVAGEVLAEDLLAEDD